ncbi:hypothetical protein FEM48_Zijuj03G0095700 [Ziziphus jujuba var. spinosa]|uniref:Uncharacterized protein n=1 Tax=Ziziphus jujuba var. spinosa TaxID=714518 RepID=A0A978VPJ0_ZIZJJ|nr:hypothetical protein FEM48_Zijuj03G0095700 [Ziziphus jujuba var. spinosa]
MMTPVQGKSKRFLARISFFFGWLTAYGDRMKFGSTDGDQQIWSPRGSIAIGNPASHGNLRRASFSSYPELSSSFCYAVVLGNVFCIPHVGEAYERNILMIPLVPNSIKPKELVPAFTLFFFFFIIIFFPLYSDPSGIHQKLIHFLMGPCFNA